MAQKNRLSTGGAINRDKTISFSFDGKKYSGFEGDTLASALLATTEAAAKSAEADKKAKNAEVKEQENQRQQAKTAEDARLTEEKAAQAAK